MSRARDSPGCSTLTRSDPGRTLSANRPRRFRDEGRTDRCVDRRVHRGVDRGRADGRHDRAGFRVRNTARRRRLLHHRHGADRVADGSACVRIRSTSAATIDPARWPFGDGDLATVRIRAEAPEGEEIFVGIAHTADVDRLPRRCPPTTRSGTSTGAATTSRIAGSVPIRARCHLPTSRTSGPRAPRDRDSRR